MGERKVTLIGGPLSGEVMTVPARWTTVYFTADDEAGDHDEYLIVGDRAIHTSVPVPGLTTD